MGEGLIEFRALLGALAWMLDAGRDFEVPETILNHVLKVHGDVIVENPDELGQELADVRSSHDKVWGRIREQLNYARCMIGFAQRIQ